MLLIIEILMLVTGLWAIFAGKAPSFLIGGGKYQIDGMYARLLGVLLILPLPTAFLGAIVLVVLIGEDGTGYAAILEIGTVAIIGIFVMILIRVIGKTDAEADPTEALIARKTNGSLIYALLGGTGIGAIIFCPLAFIYANQALRLMEQNPEYWQAYNGRAKIARIIAALFALFWGAGIICFATLTLAA